MCPGPGSVLCRQELEERCLLNVCQTWEERAEEHLTMKQEEGEGGPSRGAGWGGRALSALGTPAGGSRLDTGQRSLRGPVSVPSCAVLAARRRAGG